MLVPRFITQEQLNRFGWKLEGKQFFEPGDEHKIFVQWFSEKPTGSGKRRDCVYEVTGKSYQYDLIDNDRQCEIVGKPIKVKPSDCLTSVTMLDYALEVKLSG